MANDLQLKVILAAIDKATGPLSKIQNTSGAVGKALKATSDRMKALNSLQRDVGAYRGYEAQLASTSTALSDAKAKMGALERALESHRSVQQGLAAETNIHRRAVLNLQREMMRAKEPSAELSRQYTLAKDNLARLETKYKGSQNQLRRYKQELGETGTRAQKLGSQHNQVSQSLATLKTRLEGAGIGVDRLADHEQQLATGLERSNKLLEAQKTKLKALDNLKAKAGNVRQAGGQVMERGRSLATQATVGGAAAGYFFKTQFLDRAAEFETYKTILKTVTGSEKKAAEAMSWVSDFAAKTPYEMGDVLESFTRLKAYGIDPMADGMLKTLGDTASAMGKPVMQAVEAIADAVTGENERLKEFGIKGSKSGGQITYEYTNSAGDTMTKTVAANNRKLIQSTLQAIWNEKYAGAMDDQSKTWKGMVSNLSDQWARFTNMVMAAGLFDRMKDGLGRVLDTIDRMAASGELGAWADRVGKGMLRFADGAWQVGTAMANVSSTVANAVGGWQNLVYLLAALKFAPLISSVVSLGGSLIGAGSALATFMGAGTAAGTLGPKILAMTKTMGGALAAGGSAFAKAGLVMGGALKAVGVAMWALAANPVTWIIVGIGAAVAGAAYLIWRNWEPIKAFFLGLWAEVKAGFSGGLTGILGLLANFSPIGLFYRAFAAVMNYFGFDLPGKFTEFGSMMMQGLVNGIKNAAGAVKSAVVGAADDSINYFKEKLGIHSPSRVFAALGGFTMDGLTQGLLGGQAGPLKAIAETSKRITQAGGMALGLGASGMTFAQQPALSVDTRPPLAMPSAQRGAGQAVHQHNYTININGSGMNEAQLVDLLGKKLEQIKRGEQARARGRLSDID